jgi:phospholipid/cholesterol/gamma-HCH transport system substrate-binding protein
VKRAIRAHLTDFVAVIGLLVVALGVSYVILQNQRLRIPLLEPEPYVLKAEFTTGQAVTAGQGQTVRVAGVRIGDIGKVELKDGRAVIEMQLDQEYKDLVHADASALLRPKTGLKDMFVDLGPGTDEAPLATEGFTIPLRATQPDVNPDEIYSALDRDTRDYLQLLVNGAGRGLEGRGGDLQEIFRRFEPTHRDLARVNSAVAERRRNLRRLISDLRTLNRALAQNDDQLAGLVGSSAQVMRAFASQEQSISSAVRELPTALSTTTDTMGKVQDFGRLLGPTAERLRPVARALDDANAAVIPFAREIAPVLRSDIRPFVRDARPLARDIVSPAKRLSDSTPNLTESFMRLNRLFNLIAYNPGGKEGPEKGSARQEGYLFWIAWINHMANELFSSSDAHGTWRPTTAGAPCATIEEMVHEQPELAFLQGFTAILADSQACATQAAQDRSKRAEKAGRPLAPEGDTHKAIPRSAR